MFLESALANFLGSLVAGLFLWFLVTRVYEITKSKKARDGLLAVSYALIKREIDACSVLCQDHVKAREDQISASGPITQAWETLHSTEAFRYFSPKLSEKLVKYYSLVFRLRANIQISQLLFATRGVPVPGADPMAATQRQLRNFEKQVGHELLGLEAQLRPALDAEISKLSKREKVMFSEAYESPPIVGERK